MIENERSGQAGGNAGLNALLDAIESGVDQLVTADLEAMVRIDGPSDELHETARRAEQIRRMFAAFDARYVQAVQAGDEAARHAQPNVVAFLRHLLKISPAEAARRVRLAEACRPEVAFGAGRLPPACPAVAGALTRGAMSAEQADIVVKTLQRLPDAARVQDGAALESHLVAEARTFDPSRLAVLARHAADVLDPDGTLRDEAWQQRNRTASLHANPDGTGTLHALLTAEALEKLQTVLTPLAAPVPTGPDGPDPRDAGKRNHDALVALADRALDGGDLPASGGTRTTVVIHLTEEQLRTRTGLAVSDNGHLIPVETALTMAADAQIYSLITSSKSVPLWLGRTSRTATPGQTIALAARDRGCAQPGCDRPPALCERHHIDPWVAARGPTDIDNLVLLCGYHHRVVDRSGWTIAMRDGRPWFTPPGWMDPEQRPIRNTMHDPGP